MPGDIPITPEVPLSCGEAWIKYFLDKDLVNGIDHSNVIDAMQHAHEAGWNAALAALKGGGDA